MIPMKNQETWVVVANSSEAKIFRMKKFPKLEVISSLEHPESRLHNIDLVSSKPGRTFDKVGGGRHSYQAVTDPKHIEVEKFAKTVATYLQTAQGKNEFSKIYLIAAPAFLGLLRPLLDSKLQNSIVREVAKDMTEHTVLDIEGHLANL